MSNPQKENGFSGISNELLAEIYKRKFNGSQFSIVLCVIRWTYGFQRKSHSMSDSFISKDTLMTTKLVNRELGNLIKANVILVYKQGTYTTAREIGLNKNYDVWTIEKRVFEKSTPQSDGTLQLEGSVELEGTPQSVDKGTPQSVDKVPHNQGDKKERLNKDNKEIYDYYLSLELIKHKEYTNEMKKAVEFAIKQNKYTIEECKILLERHKKVVELTKNSDFPVKARPLVVFFGQKVANAKHLICSEYEEGGAKYETYLKEKSTEYTETPHKPQEIKCPICSGKGVIRDQILKEWVDCPKCKGKGKILKEVEKVG